jgi:predicted PurR-regulated permease PerM
MPFFIAVFISIIASGPLFWLERKKVPKGLAVLIVVLGIIGIGVGIGALVGTSLNDFTGKLPEYQFQLETKRDALLDWMHGKGLTIPRESVGTLIDPKAAIALTANILRGVGGALANTFLILLATIFILLEIATIGGKIRAVSGRKDGRIEGLDRFMDSVRRYIVIKTIVSLATGALVAIWLWLLGVDFPLLWGLLAFLLNYIPNLGSFIAAIPATAVALIQLGTLHAALAAAGFAVVNVVLGSFVEPRFMGRGLGLSTLVVFVSLIFWGWVFGPIGMLLSVLLTVMLKIALESGHETRWLAVLMGPGGSNPEPGPDPVK